MLKSCKYCGRIHDSKFDCGKRPQSKKGRTDKDKFRSTAVWQQKVEEIKQRDLYLCQVCVRNLYDTYYQYNYEDISVHHAIPLEVDFDRRLDNTILLTMCGRHHEMAEQKKIPLKIILEIIREQEESIPPGEQG
jgi:5-methylcytosine-specific restriction protein A